MEESTLKKQHRKALKLSKVAPFVFYDLRHTCLTRWAKGMDTFTLKTLAGHSDLTTTLRYVHINDSDVRAAMTKAQGSLQSDYNLQEPDEGRRSKTSASN
jgi:integrase